ncbi:ComEC/Rec2 family competence protein [Lutibacter holmesii]|uniref:ComEC/Rec2 family competence protein n=1 Tax=Lutibacter holmesii TaxID=1137985 RepID=A0ABW3WQ97_9FLAO
MRKSWKFIPLQLTIFLVVGILLGTYYIMNPAIIACTLVFLMAIFYGVFVYSNKQFEQSIIFFALFSLISVGIGVSNVTFQNNVNKEHYFEKNIGFSTVKLQKALVEIQKVLKSSNYYDKYEASVIQINSKKSLGKILINVKRDSLLNAFHVDDQIFMYTFFKEISSPKNPYEFNYKQYLKNQQIHYQVYLKKNEFIPFEHQTHSLKGVAAAVRNKINTALLQNGFQGDELAVIDALLLGQRQQISYELRESYTGAGAIHILAVSGLHVGIILLILSFLLQPVHRIKNGKLITSFIIVISLWLFALIAGLSASVVRAVTMFTAITIGMYSNRPSNMYHTLLISMFFLLIFNPNYLFEVGFQLSYLAVFSIVWIQPKLDSLISVDNWLLRKVWQLCTVSLAAQIGVVPLSLYYFHQFPGLFFISNLVIIPFLGAILCVGILIIVLALIGVLPSFLSDFYMLVIQQLNTFVSWISNQEAFIIQRITFSLLLLLVFYLLIFMFFKWVEKPTFKRVLLVLFSIILLQGAIIFEKYKIETRQSFIIFNKTKETLLGTKVGDKMKIQCSQQDFSLDDNPLKNYVVGTGIDSVFIESNIPNLYSFKGRTIFIIDSLGVFNIQAVQPDYVVLRQSPKINLERVINVLKPKLIITDASNYKSYVEQWHQTCVKTKTPFYNTMQNGAYILNN